MRCACLKCLQNVGGYCEYVDIEIDEYGECSYLNICYESED